MNAVESVRVEALEKGSSLWHDAWKRLRKNRAAIVSFAILVALIAACILVPSLSSHRYDHADLAHKSLPPSREHWMGTDFAGRDLMARVFFGGRISFAVGIVATLMSFLIGVTWGSVAGYAGGKVDAAMMRIVDILYTFPLLILVILLRVFFINDKSFLYKGFTAVFGVFTSHAGDPSWYPVFEIIAVFMALGAISWLTMARIVRGQVISLRGQPFIEAARSIGAGHRDIVFKHLVPNALGPIIVYTTLTIPEVMLTEAFLSFLGLGTQEPLASWGMLASTGADTMDLFWWQLVFPAALLALTLFCFNFLGDGLRDALDPRIRKE